MKDVILNDLLKDLNVETPRGVASPEGTRRAGKIIINENAGEQLFDDASVDHLFGQTKAYVYYKREMPAHRMMLWLRLAGHNNKEIAALTGYSAITVGNITRQPWFTEAFCRISTERGTDIVDTYLQGETIPTLQKLVSLRDTAESDAVKKAACDSILDRIRGKAVAKTEVKINGSVDNVVYDVAELMKERARNDEILRSRGIAPTGPN
jgi:hypothetical protein